MAYTLIILSAFFTSLYFVFTKMYQKTEGTSAYAGFRFTGASGLITVIVFWCANGFSMELSLYSLLMAFLQSAFTTAYTLVSLHLMKMGTMALYTLFLMTGGMIVPYYMGLLFLDEPSTLIKTIGLVVTVIGVVITNISKEKINFKLLVLCILVFFFNGGVSTVSKLHQVEKVYETVGTNDFIILTGFAKVVISCVAMIFFRNTKEVSPEFESKRKTLHWIFPCIFAVAVSSVSSYIQLDGARTIDASIIYPIITGGTIVFTALCARLFFKEKLSKSVIASILLCSLGIVLFSM